MVYNNGTYDLEEVEMKKLQFLLKKNKGWSVLIGILFLVLTGSSLYILYALSLLNNIENFLRMFG